MRGLRLALRLSAVLLMLFAVACGSDDSGVQEAVSSPDDALGCSPGGVRVNDESKGRFNQPGLYRIDPYDDLKLDAPGIETVRLSQGQSAFVKIDFPTEFEISNWGNAGHVCIYVSSTEEQARFSRAQTEQAEARQERERAVREQERRQEEAARERERKQEEAAREREAARARELRTDAEQAGITGPDGRCGADGFRINDESTARFSKRGTYRFYAHDDLKLDIDGRSTIKLPEGESVYVIVDRPADFEVHNWGSAGHACAYAATEEEEAEAARERAAAQRREAAQRALRTDEQIARECLSPWDGNHDGFERQVREVLNDPNSMTTHATYYGRSSSGEFILRMDYGARNAFGGMVRTEATAVMDTDTCEVTVLDYGG